MTWVEWVDSEYNTDGFSIYLNVVANESLTMFIDGAGDVSPSDIINPEPYWLSTDPNILGPT